MPRRLAQSFASLNLMPSKSQDSPQEERMWPNPPKTAFDVFTLILYRWSTSSLFMFFFYQLDVGFYRSGLRTCPGAGLGRSAAKAPRPGSACLPRRSRGQPSRAPAGEMGWAPADPGDCSEAQKMGGKMKLYKLKHVKTQEEKNNWLLVMGRMGSYIYILFTYHDHESWFELVMTSRITKNYIYIYVISNMIKGGNHQSKPKTLQTYKHSSYSFVGTYVILRCNCIYIYILYNYTSMASMDVIFQALDIYLGKKTA